MLKFVAVAAVCQATHDVGEDVKDADDEEVREEEVGAVVVSGHKEVDEHAVQEDGGPLAPVAAGEPVDPSPGRFLCWATLMYSGD